MELGPLIKKLETLLRMPLPDAKAHKKMLPHNRVINSLTTEELNNVRQSGVMLLLYEDNSKAHSVLIQRNTYNGVHSGQISLPGGQQDNCDANLTDTAFRECEEEIGIKREQIYKIGHLSRIYIPPSNFIVLPVLGTLHFPPSFIADINEVNALIIYDIELLLDENNVKRKTFEGHDYKIEAPYFDIKGYEVWGATAMILSEFKELLLKAYSI